MHDFFLKSNAGPSIVKSDGLVNQAIALNHSLGATPYLDTLRYADQTKAWWTQKRKKWSSLPSAYQYLDIVIVQLALWEYALILFIVRYQKRERS